MRQVFGAFGTAIVVTILQLRQTFHTAMLSQTLTPENIPLQGLLSSAQQIAAASGLTAAQGQMMGMMYAYRQVATSGSVMAFDDVFRFTAAITLIAIVPALFLRTPKAMGKRGPTIIAD